MKRIVFSISVFLVACVNVALAGGKGSNATETAPMPKILVVAPANNVNSDYYVTDMLTEGTGINRDSVSYVYNNVIANVMQQVANKENIIVLNGCCNAKSSLLKDIDICGKGEDAMVDMSKVDKAELQQEMQRVGASYLLILDQHFLKYQEQPFRTMFHFINYSFYDANEKKLGNGKSYFTSFNPQSAKDMTKSSLKSTKKIMADISKLIVH